MKTLSAILLLIACAASANAAQIVDGNYLRYEGTGFESMFFPCQSSEVWAIEGGEAVGVLVDYYRNYRIGVSNQLRTALVLTISPVDRSENPASQIDAVGSVVAILSISEDENAIASCRKQP